MNLSAQICGHSEVLQRWSEQLEADTIAGSYVFVGPPGVGKVRVARALVQQALCERSTRQACGECGSCRRMAAGEHESCLHVKPENGMIKIEQAHEILRYCQLQSLSRRRFVIIEEAQHLGASTANALLKTLEEPPAGTVFILTAPSASSLLSTIRSRSRVVNFRSLSVEEMKKGSSAPEWALRASQGRFDRLEMLTNEELKPVRQQALKNLLSLLLKNDFLTDDQWREELKNREELKSELNIWLSMVRDALLLKLGRAEDLLNPDFQKDLERLLFLSEAKLLFVFQELFEMQKQQQFNKDAVLSLESLYIQLR